MEASSEKGLPGFVYNLKIAANTGLDLVSALPRRSPPTAR
jgi:hypothetical protein